MPNLEPHFVLMGLLAVMDLAVLGIFVFFIRKTKTAVSYEKMEKAAEVLESLVSDSGRVADQWSRQLEKKHELMRRLSDQMDERLTSLTLLCTRAESLLQSGRPAPSPAPVSLTGREKKIIALARRGHRTDDIAGRLALPREEVELVLGLDKKLSGLGAGKVCS